MNCYKQTLLIWVWFCLGSHLIINLYCLDHMTYPFNEFMLCLIYTKLFNVVFNIETNSISEVGKGDLGWVNWSNLSMN